ncbi:hypothetical protein [Nocardia nova]|uniref:hypothetical protein n=1 Tax=Nocardia nova TaxID=37330 RepID=UPI0033E46F09
MTSWDDPNYNSPPPPPPGMPEYPVPSGTQRDPFEGKYEPWTRKPLFYWPILVRDEFVGYIWASKNYNSASTVRILSRANYDWMEIWDDRLDEGCRQGLRPVDAVRRWIGAPEDPIGGHIPADAPTYEAPDLDTLYQRINPGGPPAPGPLIQDGEFPDGTPVDRSKGWGPLVSTASPTYPTTTTSSIRYLPITKDNQHIAYLWASTTNDAIDYLPLHTAGRTAEIAAGLWRLRITEGFEKSIPPLEILDRCRAFPEDHMSGQIPANSQEMELPTLRQLVDFAQQDRK